METKIFKAERVDGEGLASAVIATLNVIDKDGDVTLPGAFGSQPVVVLPTHDWSSVPLAKGTIREEGEEAIGTFKFNLDTRAGMEWHSALKFDLEHGEPLQNWSYGFDVIEESKGEFEGERVRFLKKLKVHEISPVLVGAGIGTRTLAVKNQKATESEILYAEVDRSRVTRDQRELAAEILTGAASDNGIDPPCLRWFNEEGHKEHGEKFPESFSNPRKLKINGLYARGENKIWIRSDLTGADLVRTVAHEVRHGAWNDPTSEQDAEEQEKSAKDYGERIQGVYPLNGARLHFLDEKPLTGTTLKWKFKSGDWGIWNGKRYRVDGVTSFPIWRAWDL